MDRVLSRVMALEDDGGSGSVSHNLLASTTPYLVEEVTYKKLPALRRLALVCPLYTCLFTCLLTCIVFRVLPFLVNVQLIIDRLLMQQPKPQAVFTRSLQTASNYSCLHGAI